MLLCVEKTRLGTNDDGVEDRGEAEANFTIDFCNSRNSFTTSISAN